MSALSSKQRRVGVAVALLACAGGLWFVASRRSPDAASIHGGSSTASEPTPDESHPMKTALKDILGATSGTPEGGDPEELTIDAAPIIDTVLIDKEEVCQGEDVLVTVQPLPGHEGATVNVNGEFARKTVVKPDFEGDEFAEYWVVAARDIEVDYEKVEIALLPGDHPRCKREPMATIHATQQEDSFSFEVVPLRNLGKIQTVSWEFGDGATATGGARMAHDFGDRPQLTETSSFVVSATVVDDEGRAATARHSVSFMNPHYIARAYSGNRTLPLTQQRFPEGSRQGPYAASINNIEPEPVHFEVANVRLKSCKGGEPQELEVPAAQLVELAEIPPGQLAETHITLPSEWTGEDVCQVEVSLLGDTVPPRTGTPMNEGEIAFMPVSAAFTFDLGLPLPVEQGGSPGFASVPVTDPDLEARLLAALEERGTNYITEEELDALSHEN